MTDLRKAAEMALEALEMFCEHGAILRPLETKEALRQALDLQTVIAKGTKAWADVADATEWVDDLRGTDFSGALKPPLTCLETPGIVDLDKYYSVTYKSPLGASVYDVDGVKWLIENRGADYFTRDVKKVDMSEERVHKTEKSIHEPVVYLDEGLGAFYWPNQYKKGVGFTPLYAVPPHRWSNVTDDCLMEEVRRRGFVIRDAQIGREWVGLTDEEIYDYADKFLYQHGSNYGIKSFGKAIEAKLKEKNV